MNAGHDLVLDGNALGGQLAEVFRVDVTAAVATCSNCGAFGPVAGVRVYARGPGAVARCRVCEAVLLRVVRIRGVACVDLGGLRSLEISGG